MNLRSGSGWSLIDASQFAGLPGVHDLGTLLGVTTGSLLLVILRAAERWVPGEDMLGEVSAIVAALEERAPAADRVMFLSSALTVPRTL